MILIVSKILGYDKVSKILGYDKVLARISMTGCPT